MPQKGEDAINNMEMTPREYLRLRWNSHHNSVAVAQRAVLVHTGGVRGWEHVTPVRPPVRHMKIYGVVSEVSWFLTWPQKKTPLSGCGIIFLCFNITQ